MVSVGSKALQSRSFRNHSFVENSLMGGDRTKKKAVGSKSKNESFGFDVNNSKKNLSLRLSDGRFNAKKFSKHQSVVGKDTSIIRQQVDPETTRYFSEIASLLESSEMDLEEQPIICGNALEEARGKELELATDRIISHTLQTLLECCDVDHLCGFLQGCAKVFPSIAMDKSGSHVVETALKALALHLQDQESCAFIEESLSIICEVIVVNPIGMMSNCYGSHVLRRLLCLCKGVPLDSLEFHGVKSSTTLAERLNLKKSRLERNDFTNTHQGFPELLKILVSGILKCDHIEALQIDQYSSLVLQTTLKLLSGHDQELLQIVPVLLGRNNVNIVEGSFIETNVGHEIIELIKETTYSHLMEVILEVAPERLFDELFTKIFKKSLFVVSCGHCGNFVIQALVSRVRSQDQMEFIWEELGSKFEELLEMGRSGVIASLISASQRLHSHETKCCQALVSAVCSSNESPTCIVPRILFLENYFRCEAKYNWSWPSGTKMHVMGSLILQEIFRFQSEFIQPYITSITAMEADHIFETAKDAGGARVIEAFLSSNASVKQKRRLITKLRRHFGELAMNSSGSFTVEKCFTASNMSLREAIASDLSVVRTELSKTKQGPYLLRKLDIDRYAGQPDQWKSRQASIQSAYKEFEAAFGSSEGKSSKKDTFLTENAKHKSEPKDLKNMRKEIEDRLTSTATFLSISGSKRHGEGGDDTRMEKNKKSKKKKGVGSETAKLTENAAKIPFLSSEMLENKKRGKKDWPSRASRKKLKV